MSGDSEKYPHSGETREPDRLDGMYEHELRIELRATLLELNVVTARLVRAEQIIGGNEEEIATLQSRLVNESQVRDATDKAFHQVCDERDMLSRRLGDCTDACNVWRRENAEFKEELTAARNAAFSEGVRSGQCELAMVKARRALNDWVAIYADDISSPAAVERATRNIMDAGGTLAYIGDAIEALSNALKQFSNATAVERHEFNSVDLRDLRITEAQVKDEAMRDLNGNCHVCGRARGEAHDPECCKV